MEAEFAGAEAVFRTNGRAEDAASHRTKFIEFTEAGLRIQHGTRLVIGKFLETLRSFFVLIENSRHRIPGKVARQATDRVLRSSADSGGSLRGSLIQICKTALQAQRVELIDGEGTNAALRAARTAGDPVSSFVLGIRQRGVNDLNELPITGGWVARCHPERIPQQEKWVVTDGLIVTMEFLSWTGCVLSFKLVRSILPRSRRRKLAVSFSP